MKQLIRLRDHNLFVMGSIKDLKSSTLSPKRMKQAVHTSGSLYPVKITWDVLCVFVKV